MVAFTGNRNNSRVRGGSLLAAFLLLLLAGCGKSEITKTDPPSTTGNVSINTDPDSLDGPWALTGPDGQTVFGQGDSTLVSVAAGTYTVTWGELPDWNSPFAQRGDLAGGGSLVFRGAYSKDNPFAGLEFGTDSTLEVTTWNLEHFAKRGEVTVDLVARALKTMDVDILALQEIEDAGFFRDLDDRLPGWAGVRATSASYGVNLAYLYRVDGDWETDSVEEIFRGYSREFPRAPLVLKGRFKGEPVIVINNHFKCCGNNVIEEGEYWDEEVRRRDACLLLDRYVRDNYADSKVVIVGDMNDSLTDAPARNVFNIFLDAPADWDFVDLGIARGPSSGWSFPGWPSHLDHILINAPLFAAAGGSAAAVAVIQLDEGFAGGWSEYDRNVSDHLPVALKLIP